MTKRPDTWEDDPDFDKEPADYFAGLADNYYSNNSTCLDEIWSANINWLEDKISPDRKK